MKRKNLWIKISACAMAAFLATASVAPISAAYTDAFTEDVFSDTAAEYTTDESGNVNNITFAVPDKSADGVYVSMSIMMHSNDAFMKIEYATAELTSAPAEEPVKQKAPTIKVKTTAKSYKYTTLKKKAQVFTLGATVNITFLCLAEQQLLLHPDHQTEQMW